MADEDASQGYYIYCVIQTAGDRSFPVMSMDGDTHGVTTIRFMDLAAVVSPASEASYAVTRQHTLAHQLVLEAVMQEFTLLPVRFGTVARCREDVVEKLLKRKFGEFHGLLNYLNGKVELGLKVLWKREPLFAQIVAENPIIRHMHDALSGRPEAQSRYERIQLGEMVGRALEIKREEDAARLLAALRPLADDLRVNKPLMDTMILNAAFLVPKANQKEVDSKVNELDQSYEGNVLFKYVGPVPPYNFVHVSVQWD